MYNQSVELRAQQPAAHCGNLDYRICWLQHINSNKLWCSNRVFNVFLTAFVVKLLQLLSPVTLHHPTWSRRQPVSVLPKQISSFSFCQSKRDQFILQKRSMKDEEYVVWICRHGQHEKEETVCLWSMLKCPSLCPTSDHLYSFSLWGSAHQKSHKEFFIKLKLWCCPVKFITQQNRTSSDKHTSSCCCVFVFFMFLPTASKCLLQDSRRSGFWRPVGSGRTENRFSRFQLNTDQQGNGDKIYVLDESERFDRRQRRSSSCRLLPAQTFNM